MTASRSRDPWRTQFASDYHLGQNSQSKIMARSKIGIYNNDDLLEMRLILNGYIFSTEIWIILT